jgi:hypothetical protein
MVCFEPFDDLFLRSTCCLKTVRAGAHAIPILLLLTVHRDWRVGHAMSHHLFPNSLLDLDISMFAPLFKFLPDPSKTWWGRYGPWIYSPLVYSIMFYGHMFLR